jgi:hypothetical protein
MDYPGCERREFIRHRHEKPVRYSVLNTDARQREAAQFMDAVSKNLSASGILFSTTNMPKLSSLLMLELDRRATNICREIEENALVIDDKLFGKVVRIEDAGSGRYDVGVAFIKRFDTIQEKIKGLL